MIYHTVIINNTIHKINNTFENTIRKYDTKVMYEGGRLYLVTTKKSSEEEVF